MQRKPLEKKLAGVEAEMAKVSDRLGALDALVGDPTLYDDARRNERLKVLAEHGELNKRKSELEEQWLELQEELEALAASLSA